MQKASHKKLQKYLAKLEKLHIRNMEVQEIILKIYEEVHKYLNNLGDPGFNTMKNIKVGKKSPKTLSKKSSKKTVSK